jgi:hypothetical protein
MNKTQNLIGNFGLVSFRNTMYNYIWGDAWSAFHISIYNSINDLLDSSMFESIHDLVDDSVRRKYEQ